MLLMGPVEEAAHHPIDHVRQRHVRICCHPFFLNAARQPKPL